MLFFQRCSNSTRVNCSNSSSMVQLLQLASSSLHVLAVHRQITSLALFVASRFNPRPLKTQKRGSPVPKGLFSLNLYSKYWSTENHPLISNCFKNLLSWIIKTSLHASCYFQYSMHKNKALVRIGPKINKHIPTIQNDLSKLFGFM